MKKLKLLVPSVWLVIFLTGVTVASAESFKIMTEEYPPCNFTQDGNLTGLSTEVLMEPVKRGGHPTDVEVLPWARAYGLIQQIDGLIVYSMTRTEAREGLFKWVGLVASNKWVLLSKKGSGVSLSSLDDAKKDWQNWNL